MVLEWWVALSMYSVDKAAEAVKVRRGNEDLIECVFGGCVLRCQSLSQNWDTVTNVMWESK
jgi:hypothetical protein